MGTVQSWKSILDQWCVVVSCFHDNKCGLEKNFCDIKMLYEWCMLSVLCKRLAKLHCDQMLRLRLRILFPFCRGLILQVHWNRPLIIHSFTEIETALLTAAWERLAQGSAGRPRRLHRSTRLRGCNGAHWQKWVPLGRCFTLPQLVTLLCIVYMPHFAVNVASLCHNLSPYCVLSICHTLQ